MRIISPWLAGGATDIKGQTSVHSIPRLALLVSCSTPGRRTGPNTLPWMIIGLTPEGRTTVNLLQLNNDERLAERRRFPTG
jgi:hypothetical protein